MTSLTSLNGGSARQAASRQVKTVAAIAQVTPSTLGTGIIVLVVGPSGAGKDTLIRMASDRLAGAPGIRFVRRQVTRKADPSLEDHDALDAAAFAAVEARGAFALTWSANGLSYGIPSSVDTWFMAGDVVVANVSRTVISTAAAKYGRVVVVHVTAPLGVLAARLSGRGRETAGGIGARLARAGMALPNVPALLEIENVGDPARAAAALEELLHALRRLAPGERGRAG